MLCFRVVWTELSRGIRRIVGLHFVGAHLRLQQIRYPAGCGLQRWPHRHLGHTHAGHCQNHIRSCASGVQHELVQRGAQGNPVLSVVGWASTPQYLPSLRPLQLLSASTDNNVCIWDVLTGDCVHKYRFPSPVLKVQFDPRNDNRFLVCPMRYAAVLVTIDAEHKCLPLDTDVGMLGRQSCPAGLTNA